MGLMNCVVQDICLLPGREKIFLFAVGYVYNDTPLLTVTLSRSLCCAFIRASFPLWKCDGD